MIGNKYWEKRGCRRPDDKVAAVVTLSINGYEVRTTSTGLFTLADYINKYPEACVAFNITELTGHYICKNVSRLAKVLRVKSSDLETIISGGDKCGNYICMAAADLTAALPDILNSDRLLEAHYTAEQQDTISTAGDVAYKVAWLNLWNGRGYSYYSDPNIMRHRVSSAYTCMAGKPSARPKRKVLK